jgi:hypothetical protein
MTMYSEGQQIGVEQEVDFVQCFFWFVENASFLAWEYKAREGIVVEKSDVDRGWTMGVRARSKDVAERSLKLKIRIKGSARGRAGVWRVE